MTLGQTATVVAAIALLALVCWWLVAQNRFVRQRQHLQESWRDVDVELRRRHDLVPGLVRTLEAYAAHEQALVEVLTAERGLLGGAVASAAEAYPALGADTLFIDLQHRLADIEARLAAARRIHAANVRAYNTRVQAWPTSLVARAGGFPAATEDGRDAEG